MRVFSFIIAMVAIYVFGYQDEYSAIAQQQREAFDLTVISQEIMYSFETGDTTVLEGYM